MTTTTPGANRRDRFRRVDLALESQRNADLAREFSGRTYSFFRGEVTPFEFKKSQYYFRFLPQPADAQNSWSLILPYVNLDPKQTPGHRGYLPLTIRQAALVDSIRGALYRHPDFGSLMASPSNRNGISMSVKYSSLFQGFCHNDPAPKVTPIALPSNGFTAPKDSARLKAGTIITRFMFDRDSAGGLKYGDIVDLDEGRLIGIEISSNNDRREFAATVDRVFPIAANHEHLLDQVMRFEDIVDYQTDDIVHSLIRLKLTLPAWGYVAAKFQLPSDPLMPQV